MAEAEDLQSFLATLVNQNQDEASKVEDSSDMDTAGCRKLQAPFNTLDIEDMDSIQPICECLHLL